MATTPNPSGPQRFELAFSDPYRQVGRLFGIRPDTAYVDVDDLWVDAHLGPWHVRTSRQNVAATSITGPYALPLTIGPAHLSLTDRGLTFATNGARGVCLRFHRPVRGLDPLGLVRHPGLTVTVADPEGLVALLAEEPGPTDEEEQVALDNLHTMTASELRALAAERNIDHRSARKKAELVALIEADLSDDLVDELAES